MLWLALLNSTFIIRGTPQVGTDLRGMSRTELNGQPCFKPSPINTQHSPEPFQLILKPVGRKDECLLLSATELWHDFYAALLDSC